MANDEKLLEEAYQKVKQINVSSDRFKIPKVQGHFEGRKTIVTNFFHKYQRYITYKYCYASVFS
ncbi:hypothetical protein KAT36_03935 [Candidatus Pacearchaeota archaeon]|nr:hypothetical protein [Candidatus Pacearchaeota archaeon]